MGMEALNNAARAAGFAMAVSEEPVAESAGEAKPEQEAWRAGQPMLTAAKPGPSTIERVRSFLGLFGRGAPA